MPRAPSAGLVLYRPGPEVLLGHMGGPFFARKDAGAWSIPKGEYGPDELPLDAARREFAEELGSPAPDGDYIELGQVRQSGGKIVHAWAVAGDLDVTAIVSNTFELEWPRGSGRLRTYPELDRAAWFGLDAARERIVAGQVPFLDRLETQLES